MKSATIRVSTSDEILLTIIPKVRFIPNPLKLESGTAKLTQERSKVEITGSIEGNFKKLPEKIRCNFYWMIASSNHQTEESFIEAIQIQINDKNYSIKDSSGNNLELDVIKHFLIGSNGKVKYNLIPDFPHAEFEELSDEKALSFENPIELNMPNINNAKIGQNVNIEFSAQSSMVQDCEFTLQINEHDKKKAENENNLTKVKLTHKDKFVWQVGCSLEKSFDDEKQLIFIYPKEKERGPFEFSSLLTMEKKNIEDIEKPKQNTHFRNIKTNNEFIKNVNRPQLTFFNIEKMDEALGIRSFRISGKINDISSDLENIDLLINIYNKSNVKPNEYLDTKNWKIRLNNGNFYINIHLVTDINILKGFIAQAAKILSEWVIITSLNIEDIVASMRIPTGTIVGKDIPFSSAMYFNTVKNRAFNIVENDNAKTIQYSNNGHFIFTENYKLTNKELLDNEKVIKVIYKNGQEDETVKAKLEEIQKKGWIPSKDYAMKRTKEEDCIQRALTHLGYRTYASKPYGPFNNGRYAKFISTFNPLELYKEDGNLITDQDEIYQFQNNYKSLKEPWFKITAHGFNTILYQIILKSR